MPCFRLQANPDIPYRRSANDKETVHQHADYAAWVDERVSELHDAAGEWELLPLIVLAGLR